jgi:hypothetical protein
MIFMTGRLLKALSALTCGKYVLTFNISVMKKIIFTAIIASLCLSSCDSRKRDIEAYLKKNEPVFHSLEIIEVSKSESIYSPFDYAMSLTFQYVEILSEMTKLQTSALEASSKKETLKLLDEAITVGHSIDSLVHELLIEIDYPILAKKPHNRVGCKAKYRLNGILTENTFYYNRNESTIGHTDKDIKKYGKEIVEYIHQRTDNEIEIKKDIRDYKSGRYYLRTWK